MKYGHYLHWVAQSLVSNCLNGSQTSCLGDLLLEGHTFWKLKQNATARNRVMLIQMLPWCFEWSCRKRGEYSHPHPCLAPAVLCQPGASYANNVTARIWENMNHTHTWSWRTWHHDATHMCRGFTAGSRTCELFQLFWSGVKNRSGAWWGAGGVGVG